MLPGTARVETDRCCTGRTTGYVPALLGGHPVSVQAVPLTYPSLSRAWIPYNPPSSIPY